MHAPQRRASGDPYFIHPVRVALYLAEKKLDPATIATALLHDVVEDTDATNKDICKMFGPTVGELVEGVTKLTHLEETSNEVKQAENFRKLLLALSRDIRVLLVKLSDRLDNMRTLHFINKAEKRARIATETLEIYAPLASRIGMVDLREELEDLAFSQLMPEARESILQRTEFLREQGDALTVDIIRQLREDVTEAGLKNIEINGRIKTPYSIWKKMQTKDLDLGQLSDIVAFRVIVPSLGDCYAALGALHAKYSHRMGRYKDYISTPKPNGYQSIHTVVIGPENQSIEVQIRNQDMHRRAELGLAAHWAYKDGTVSADLATGDNYNWVKQLIDLLEQSEDPQEFLDNTKIDLFQNQVFCFTPRGHLISLSADATVVDFAYAVHSDVGNTCVGAKINGKIRPLHTVLRNGDQVDILRSKNAAPNPEWLNIVVSAKARASIRRYIRNAERDQHVALGRQILARAYRMNEVEAKEKALDGIAPKWRLESGEDVLAQVGAGLIPAGDVVRTLFPGIARENSARSKEQRVLDRLKSGETFERGQTDPTKVELKGLIKGMAVHFARCCHPLPGERIVGIVATGKGITIHTIDCDNLVNFYEQPERWLEVGWETSTETPHVGRLRVILSNEPGALGTLTTLIGRTGGNILNFKFLNRQTDFFETLVDVEVDDLRQLNVIIATLRSAPSIESVERQRG
ncbi:MAG: bifunctional (p)ppGpp synthetase/guanosine-3',5'-bis(diphosphate) 3'-pyrophosphohydrolase [Alphaproteobacteria bacterium TMED89]|nr:bifunctional (p)ppGpp synthetase/guanosine-3',5'-bis(diphosphate) 3'-pyrophosphohydrolase [Rhodospirillaceae bacterium]RPH19235.1 MAG: bifunctional (p)ppGpp synthetase/guanosine-3',5'-bis(diphosphate) 3'-pyrophosphohydrolase [Alphaproteobacteria bacterium TMED89]